MRWVVRCLVVGGWGVMRSVALAGHIDSTDAERKMAAGQGQLAQGTVAALRLSEWAALYLHPDVQKEADRDVRLAMSLMMAGHKDAPLGKVRPPPVASFRSVPPKKNPNRPQLRAMRRGSPRCQPPPLPAAPPLRRP